MRNRALMGSNMQRQAVPGLMTTEAPGRNRHGREKAAETSGVCAVAKQAGTILSVTSTRHRHDLRRRNKERTPFDKIPAATRATAITRSRIVSKVKYVEEHQVCDLPSTGRRTCARQNPLIGFDDVGRLQLRGCCPHFRKTCSG